METNRALHSTWLRWLLLGVLLALRVPSLVQPSGADQSLYSYIGLQILAGGAPYLDGWDQKPPGIHLLYALLWAVWPDERVVAAADLVAAVVVSWLLVRLGSRVGYPGAGWMAAWIFALLANPSIQRLSGVFVRGQCETFIALAVTAALLLAIEPRRPGRAAFGAGLLLGVAIWLKYNAVVFALPVIAALRLWPGQMAPRTTAVRDLLTMAAGAAVMGIAGLAYLAWHGAVGELWLATFLYNAHYSSEPFAGPVEVARYIAGLPFRRAHYDLLWWLGLCGLLLASIRMETRRVAIWLAAWIGAAVAAIVLNGRDLPQYFVQATPALSLAAGLGLWSAWQSRRIGRVLVAGVLVVGFWRIGTEAPVAGIARLGGMPGLVDNLRFDIDHWRGRIDRTTYLDRFGGQRFRDKYAARDVAEMADVVRETTEPGETIYVFGFSPGIYVQAGRRSASRFFWNVPIVTEFAADRPGYGSRGLLEDLQAARPALVILQRGDWDPVDSVTYFMAHPALSAWLRAGYEPSGETRRYVIWRRVDVDDPNADATTSSNGA